MSTVWDVQKAVLGSTLPSPDRLIVLTLCSLADMDTGVIPDKYSPSFTDIARMTGLGRSTVARRMNVLEEQKWIDRTSPSVVDAWSKKETNRYAVRVGTSPATGLVPQRDHSEDIETDDVGSGLVPERDVTSPAAGHEVPTKNPPKNKNSSSVKPPRPDVEEICLHLADRIEGNGSLRPTITDKWRDSARLMIDKDGRDLDKIHIAINWAHDDDFWCGVIKSMPKFRAQYDSLRLAAVAKAKRTPNSRAPTTPSAPEKVPIADQCREHPGRRADGCGLCRAARIGSPKSTERRAS